MCRHYKTKALSTTTFHLMVLTFSIHEKGMVNGYPLPLITEFQSEDLRNSHLQCDKWGMCSLFSLSLWIYEYNQIRMTLFNANIVSNLANECLFNLVLIYFCYMPTGLWVLPCFLWLQDIPGSLCTFPVNVPENQSFFKGDDSFHLQDI